MSWTDITKAYEDLVEGECYSIRANRTPENMKIFPQMKKGDGKYKLNCVRFIRRTAMHRNNFEHSEINRAGGILVFEYLDPYWRGAHGARGQPIRNNRIILYHANGIEIKPVICQTAENRGATKIQSRFRGNKSRLSSKAEGRITREQLASDWLSLKRQMQASGFSREQIERFHRDHYMASLKKKKRRRSSKKKRRHSSKKKKKSKGRKTK